MGTTPSLTTTTIQPTQTSSTVPPPCAQLPRTGAYRGKVIKKMRVPDSMAVTDKWNWCARTCSLEQTCQYWYFGWGVCRLQSTKTVFVPKDIPYQSHGLRDDSASCLNSARDTQVSAKVSGPCARLE